MSETRPSEVPEARLMPAAAYPADSATPTTQLDRLAALAARLCGASIGLVTLVDGERESVVGCSGITMTEAAREHSPRAHAVAGTGCLVVPDASADPRFSDHPWVAGPPFVRFFAGQPLVSPEGLPLGSLSVIGAEPRAGLAEDQVQALETLADAATALLERGRIERISEQLRARSHTEIAALEQRFRVLADAMPQLVWSTTPDGMADYVNGGWCEFIGRPADASYGLRWSEFIHDEDKAAAEECWAHAVATGRDYEVQYRLLRHDGEYRWVLARGMPLRDPSGAITRWLGTCTDIHEQKADAQRLEVLSRELNHRIKNIFAVIGGLVAMTIRSKPEFRDAGIELRDRVLALGRAHDFVRSRGGRPVLQPHARLRGLLTALLAPYQDADATRIAVAGADVAIDDRSATPLALFFHELATNSTKYGSLSCGDGGVDIVIREHDDAVELAWREHGGPCIAGPPQERGFGSTLVEMSILRQLGGTLEYDWRAEGLGVTARIPASALSR